MKKSEEFLIASHIPANHPNAVRIIKLVEKFPNYELFFLRSHFGREAISVDDIEKAFRTIQDKNIKTGNSVDHYVKYVVRSSFEQDVMGDNGKKSKMKFKAGEDITENYRFVYKENRDKVEQRTNFEAFSDEIRDAMTRLGANKIIQQFPAAGKKVVDDLSKAEKKEFYFNLNTLLDTNTRYMVVMPFKFKYKNENGPEQTFTYPKDKKISAEEFERVPTEQKKFLAKITEKPLLAFIKKSARYKSKEALFADLNAALYSLSGDEEYKKTIEMVEDTVGAILEGVNHEQGIVVVSTLNADAYKRVGGDKTQHCIRTQSTFASYQRFGGKQYLIVNTKLEPSDDYRIIGLTIDGKGVITAAHTKSDANIRQNIDTLLKKWGVNKYVNPMTDDEIIEMLYAGINDETIFSNEERGTMVIKFLPKLDKSRYDKKKLLNLLRFTKDEAEMKKIIKQTLEHHNSKEFLENYDYLSHNILKLVNDDKQAHEMVMNYVREFNDSVGLTKEDCMKMLLNKSKYVQPNRLIEIISKKKFVQYIGAYSFEQEKEILDTLPQLFIYFLRDRETDGQDIKLIINSMYSYEKREEIRTTVLTRMAQSGQLKKVTKRELEKDGLLAKIKQDNSSLLEGIPA